jgi:hypothetical protein
VGSPLGVWTKAIVVLFLCYVLSLRCVMHVRSVRANSNRRVALLSSFFFSLFLVSKLSSVFGNLGTTCGCLVRVMVEDHVFI